MATWVVDGVPYEAVEARVIDGELILSEAATIERIRHRKTAILETVGTAISRRVVKNFDPGNWKRCELGAAS